MKRTWAGVEIADHRGPGYRPLLDSDGDWMAAIMNGRKGSWAAPREIEQHPATDELFVLVAGRARLITAGRGRSPGKPRQREMKKFVLYNVKAGTWHATPMTQAAKFIIIERKGTNIDGSRLVPLGKTE
jgi:hypothetical protein